MFEQIAILMVLALAPSIGADEAYVAEIEAYRAEKEKDLRAEDGWLSVVGLPWLAEGRSTIGSAPDSDVVLPASAPARFGVLEVAGERVNLRLGPGATARQDGEGFAEAVLQLPDEESRHAVELGDVSFHLIRRGERLGLRVRDRNSRERRSFGGLEWYGIEPRFRVAAKFVAAPGKIPVARDAAAARLRHERPIRSLLHLP